MIGIYKITNLINNKVYIGQSTNIKRRFREHKNSYNNSNRKDYESKKNRAFRKYGIENFSFEIIEEVNFSLLDEREKYWIKKYNSIDNGYNSCEGGHVPSLKGEKHSQAKLNDKKVKQIIEMLRSDNNDLQIIADEFKVSKGTISNINTGKNWTKDYLKYPISILKKANKGENHHSALFTNEEVMNMRKLYQTHTLSEIQKIYSKRASASTIEKIITGDSYKHLPVYKKRKKKWIEACID